MSQGHIGSRLLLKGQIVPVGFNSLYLNFDSDEKGILYGDLVSGQGNYTIKKCEGLYGGAVAIEEGTTNFISGNNFYFAGNAWSTNGGATTVIQNIYMPQWGTNSATRILISGSNNMIKYYYTHPMGITVSGNSYTYSMHMQNNGIVPVSVELNGMPVTSAVVNSGESKIIEFTSIADQNNAIPQIRIITPNIIDILDIVVFDPQLEQKAHRTSFVNGSRGTGYLSYPKEILNPRSFTVSTWAKFNFISGFQQVIFELTDASHANNRIVFYYLASNLTAIIGDNSNEVTNMTPFTPVAGQWYMLTLSFDGSKYNMYIGRQLVNSVSSTIVASPLPAATFNLGGRYFGLINGLLDDTLIAPYALSNEEIAAICVSGIPLFNPYDKRGYAY